MKDYTIETAEINLEIEIQERDFKKELAHVLGIASATLTVSKNGEIMVNMPEQKMGNGSMQHEHYFSLGYQVNTYSI